MAWKNYKIIYHFDLIFKYIYIYLFIYKIPILRAKKAVLRYKKLNIGSFQSSEKIIITKTSPAK